MCLDGSGICAVVFWLQLHFPPKLELGYTVLQSCSYFANVLISVQLLETTSKACATFDFFFYIYLCELAKKCAGFGVGFRSLRNVPISLCKA